MPRSQASPGGAFPPEAPLSPSVSPAIARGAIYLVTDKLRDIRIKFGFVVEGRERDERCRNQNSRCFCSMA